jgi:hypothetical protein
MSGPIVRKYGFPNFDDIFGKRDLQHGVDEAEDVAGKSKPQGEESTSAEEAAPPAGKKPGGAKSKG